MKITDSMQCDIWYQALLERAVEFTGVFFVGVKTTGVFCISVCRARKPRRENVEFYNDFKSALDAGFMQSLSPDGECPDGPRLC